MSHDIREVAVVVIAAFVAGFFGLWNTLLEMEVLDLVNTKLPPEKQYSPVTQKYNYFALRKVYRRLFPAGTLLRKADRVKLVAISIFLSGVVLQLFLNHARR